MPSSSQRKVSVVIADDEPVARAGLRSMLAEVEWVSLVGEAANGPAAVDQINRLTPDLVLLDIQMPGLLGTEVLRRIEHQPFVVFTTAHAQHAVTAFELGALDYLLKPFGAERLAKTLERVRAALGEPSGLAAFDRLREALSAGPLTRLFVRTAAGIIPLAVERVEWFEARGDYVAAHAGGARHLIHLSLNRLEERLDPKHFLRIHRTHIVNLDQVRGFQRQGKGRLIAELSDGTTLAVSRGRAAEVRGL
jgi:two-component system LytT family response regulator